MWQIASAEFAYHRKLFVGFLCLIPVFWLLAAIPLPEDLPLGFWMFMVLFMLLQSWTAARNKEMRDRKQMCLPVSAFAVATSRVLVVAISTLGYIAIYFLVIRLFHMDSSLELRVLLKAAAFISIGFAIYFILRDQTRVFFVRIGFTRGKVIVGIGLLLIALNLLGLLAFRQLETTGQLPVDPKPVIHLIVESDPFSGVVGAIKFLAWTSVFGALTIASFLRRKSYLE